MLKWIENWDGKKFLELENNLIKSIHEKSYLYDWVQIFSVIILIYIAFYKVKQN